MFNLKRKRNAFTLAETIFVCSIFAIFVLGIILGINRAFAYMNNTRVLVRATNFAREGVEMVYNLRDTNRRRCSGNRDSAWFYRGGLADCKDLGGDLLEAGIYVIKEGTNEGDSYIYAEYLTGGSDDFYSLEGFFNESSQSEREKAKITFSGAYSYYSGGTIATGNLEDLLKGTGIEFYRILRVFGVYCKNDTDPNQPVDSYHCKNDTDPRELRFCVKVFYEFNGSRHASELCSIMTNFME